MHKREEQQTPKHIFPEMCQLIHEIEREKQTLECILQTGPLNEKMAEFKVYCASLTTYGGTRKQTWKRIMQVCQLEQ